MRSRRTGGAQWSSQRSGDGSDDAAEAQVFELDALPSPIVFDHPTILSDYIAYQATGKRPPVRR